MDFFVYRNGSFLQKLAPTEMKLTRSLSGVFFITFKTEQDIQNDDVLKTEINSVEYTFNIAKEKQVFKAYHRIYNLSKKLFLRETDAADQFGIIGYQANKTALETYLNNLGFNFVDNLDESLKDNLKPVDYSGDNVLSALSKFLEAFGAEHEFDDTNIYIKNRVGESVANQVVRAGVNTNAIQKEINTNNIVTRLYPKGKSDNLDILENYYYNELRPVAYDFTSKKIEDNPVLYLDSSVIEQYGVIEQIKEFDTKIHNLNGVITGWGTLTINEKDYNYIDIDKTIDLTVLEENQCSLFINKGFEKVEDVRIDFEKSTENRIVYYPQVDNKDLTTIDFNGGSYILMGYITQTQYDEAKNSLIAEANNYLEQHKEAKINYKIDFAYLSQQIGKAIELDINIGDTIRLIDKEQGIDTEVRVIDFEYDLNKYMYSKVTFSNTFERVPVNSLIDEMYVKLLEQQKAIKEQALQLNSSVQTARTALERHELLVQKQFYGSENEYVKIGSPDRNYQTQGLEINPGLERLEWSSFRFQENAEDISFEISAGAKTETTQQDYFMSIKIDRTDPDNLNNNNIIELTTTLKKGIIDGYTYYPLGVVRFIPGEISIPAVDKGFTLIHGDFIQTGTVSLDKLLATGFLRVGNTDNGYELDPNGFYKLLDTQKIPLTSIIYEDEHTFASGETAFQVNLPFTLDNKNYEVLITEKGFKYWDENFQTQQKRFLNKYVSNKQQDSFLLNCFTEVENTITQINSDIALNSDTGWMTLYVTSNTKEITIKVFGNTYTKTYSSSGNYTLQYKFTNTPLGAPTFNREYKLEINWGDGTNSTYTKTILAQETTTEVYRRELWFSGVDTVNFTGYSETKGLKYISFPDSPLDDSKITPQNYGLSNDYKVTIESQVIHEAWFKWYKGSTLIDDYYVNVDNNNAVVSKTELISLNPGATLTLLNKKLGTVTESAEATIKFAVIGY